MKYIDTPPNSYHELLIEKNYPDIMMKSPKLILIGELGDRIFYSTEFFYHWIQCTVHIVEKLSHAIKINRENMRQYTVVFDRDNQRNVLEYGDYVRLFQILQIFIN